VSFRRTIVGWVFCLSGLTACQEDPAPGPALSAPAPDERAAVQAASAPPPAAPGPPSGPKPTIELADEGPFEVIDLHVDTPWRVHFKGRDASLPEGHATPALLAAGHYAAIVYPIYIPDYLHEGHPTIADADAIYDTIDRLIGRHEVLVPAVAPGKERRAVAADKIGVFVAIEGAGAFAEDISQIDRFVARGVRLVGPVHARDNALAGAATGKKKHGLTDLGKEFCGRVYAAGGLVDVSHMSDRSFADLVPIANKHRAPIVATHSNARAIAKHDRNLTDEQLTIIADSGGVVGLNLHRVFVGSGKMKTVVDQVMHMVKVAGVDHVAVGSDFDGGNPASSVKDAGAMPKLAAALKKAGLSDRDIRKIFGENARRILYWGL
jgi:membrane dipeptidase